MKDVQLLFQKVTDQESLRKETRKNLKKLKLIKVIFWYGIVDCGTEHFHLIVPIGLLLLHSKDGGSNNGLIYLKHWKKKYLIRVYIILFVC